MQELKVLRVCIYCRVSTEEQALHGFSMAAQEDALVEYAKANGLKVVGIYRDEGNSARKPILKRKVVLELLEDAKAGKFDRILFLKLDRWTRNVREFHAVQSVLDKHGVTWQAIMEDYNTVTADGRLKLNIMLSVAENEADRTSERIRFVFKNKLERGEVFFGGDVPPFGYKVEKIDGVRRLVKDPEKEEVVSEFFRIALAYGVHRAALDVNERFGYTRRYHTWAAMAKKEVYTGSYNGVKGFCPPYITEEQYHELHDKWLFLKKPRTRRVYLFSGLMRCPVCGNRLIGCYMVNPRGKDYQYYRCSNGVHGTACTFKRRVSEIRIEQYLLANVRKELEQYILTSEVKETKKPAKKPVNLQKLKEQLRRLNNAYIAGNMTDEEYDEVTLDIKGKIAKAEAQTDDDKPADLEALKELLKTDFEGIYSTLEEEDKRRLWRSAIKEIIVDDEGFTASGLKFKS